jgi:hypothetical protein
MDFRVGDKVRDVGKGSTSGMVGVVECFEGASYGIRFAGYKHGHD